MPSPHPRSHSCCRTKCGSALIPTPRTVRGAQTSKSKKRRSRCGAAEMNPTRNLEVAGSTLDLAQWVKDPAWLWLDIGRSCSSDSTPSLGTSICCGCGPRKKEQEDKVSTPQTWVLFRSSISSAAFTQRTVYQAWCWVLERKRCTKAPLCLEGLQGLTGGRRRLQRQ